MKIIHTSSSMEGQIYIPALNYTLMVVTIILVVSFQSSANLSSAYGLAVTADMTLTTFLFASVAKLRWKWYAIPWAAAIIMFLCGKCFLD
jgi:KUP system potassium uptake protein